MVLCMIVRNTVVKFTKFCIIVKHITLCMIFGQTVVERIILNGHMCCFVHDSQAVGGLIQCFVHERQALGGQVHCGVHDSQALGGQVQCVVHASQKQKL